MRNLGLVIFLIVTVLIGTTSITHAGEKYQKDGFSITLPGDWEEIPRDVIDNFESELSGAVPDVPAQHYDSGFQLDNARKWFDYPYILIQVNNSGRIPETQLKKMDEYPLQKSLDKQKDGFKTIVSNIQAGKMYFDKSSRIIWARMEIDVVNVGQVSSLSGLIPTEKGFIAVHGYSPEGDFNKYMSIFQTIAESVTPDPGLAYTPRWSDSLPGYGQLVKWGRVAGMTLVGAAIGGIIALIVVLKRRKAAL